MPTQHRVGVGRTSRRWRRPEAPAPRGRTPRAAARRADADKAEKAVKKFTKSYRRALAELFQDNDFHNIFRRKEIYTQLSHAALRMNVCNSTLLDIVVKLT